MPAKLIQVKHTTFSAKRINTNAGTLVALDVALTAALCEAVEQAVAHQAIIRV
jgi:hypothetical protein